MLGGIEKKTNTHFVRIYVQEMMFIFSKSSLSEGFPFKNKLNQNMGGKVDTMTRHENIINFHFSSYLRRTSFLLLRGKG